MTETKTLSEVRKNFPSILNEVTLDRKIVVIKRRNPRMIRRVIELMKAVQRNPFEGIGAPEKLKGMKDRYSRRIDREHRLVDTVKNDLIVFQQCRYHYRG